MNNYACTGLIKFHNKIPQVGGCNNRNLFPYLLEVWGPRSGYGQNQIFWKVSHLGCWVGTFPWPYMVSPCAQSWIFLCSYIFSNDAMLNRVRRFILMVLCSYIYSCCGLGLPDRDSGGHYSSQCQAHIRWHLCFFLLIGIFFFPTQRRITPGWGIWYYKTLRERKMMQCSCLFLLCFYSFGVCFPAPR